MLTVGYYSQWIEVVEVANKTSGTVALKLKAIFMRYRVLKVMRMDNGPCYAGREFAELIKEWNVKHVRSSLTNQRTMYC